MATPVPAVNRAMQMLSLLAEKPQVALTLTEISSALGIHKGTCYSIVMALSSYGLVIRDETARTYTLGPMAIELGHAAVAGFDGADAAIREMYRLHDRLGVSTLVAGLVDDEIVVLAFAGDRAGQEVGRREPAVPPMGLVYKAWSDQREAERWLRSVEELGGTDSVEYSRQALSAARERGYVLGLAHDAHQQVAAQIDRIRHCADPDERVRLALELADLLRASGYSTTDAAWPTDRQVRFISAPVLRSDDHVDLAITIFDIPSDVPFTVLQRWSHELIAAAHRASRPTTSPVAAVVRRSE